LFESPLIIRGKDSYAAEQHLTTESVDQQRSSSFVDFRTMKKANMVWFGFGINIEIYILPVLRSRIIFMRLRLWVKILMRLRLSGGSGSYPTV
jgi:hypothetical protein